MKRYRKGETFRPPTSAESAASADALEGHRSRPPLPQDRLARGGKILVKTHSDGIDARDGTTIYSAMCTRCVETSTAEEKEILETDEEIEVFNLETAAVAGDIYVQTGLTMSGTRCVEESGGGIHWGKLDADLTYNDNTGVTVSVWTGKPASDAGWDIENVVIAELLMTSGQLDSGSFVKIELIDGIWYVTGAPC